MVNPRIIGLSPSCQIFVKIERMDEITPLHFHAFIEAIENVRIGQTMPPIVLQSIGQNLLVVVVFRKRTRNTGNPHLVSSIVGVTRIIYRLGTISHADLELFVASYKDYEHMPGRFVPFSPGEKAGY